MEEKEINPLVSICLITYNHEKYIKQAVDSILCQTMDFAYELLIADDASTDRTQQILKENYSDVENVRLILREKNSKGKNAYLSYQEAKGKYIYKCEGDDYWIGTDGLQVLVNWLETHEDFVGVCGRRVSLSEKTGFQWISYNKMTDNQEIVLDDFLIMNKIFDACAVLYRNFYQDGQYDYRSYLACQSVADVTTSIYILLHGKIFQLDKVVGIYRTDRLTTAGSYNVTHTSQMAFEDHIKLLQNLTQLIGVKLDYSDLKKRYTSWYVDSLPSTYEFVKQILYLKKMVGISIAIDFIKRWINNNKK